MLEVCSAKPGIMGLGDTEKQENPSKYFGETILAC